MGGTDQQQQLRQQQSSPSFSNNSRPPKHQQQQHLEQVIELDDESGNVSDTFLTLESLLDQDINLDEPLPLLPSDYDAASEPYPVPSSSSSNYTSTNDASQQKNTSTASTEQQQQKRDPDLVIIPHHHDVLLGRGGRNNQWSGNECLRQLARVMAVAYGSAHKRDKPALAWRLIQQVRSLDPPGRFLKQKVAAGDWFEVSDDIAREKASQCLRDIVAASRSGFSENSRKRAYQSAPELNAKRMRVSGLMGAAAATSNNNGSMQNATFRQPILTPMMPTSMNPTTLSSSTSSSNVIARVMPPKAVSCMTLGAPNASTRNIATAVPGGNSTTQYNDRLLQQLQLVRAQTQQQQFLASADATANSQRNLMQSMSTASNMNTSSSSFANNPGQARSVSFAVGTTNASFAQQPQLQAAFPSQSGISSTSGWANANNWNSNNTSAMLMSTDNLQQQQQHPSMLGWQQQQQNNGTNASWGNTTTNNGTTNAAWNTTTTSRPVLPTITPSATIVAGTSTNASDGDALKRWIDRMTTTTNSAANANNSGNNNNHS